MRLLPFDPRPGRVIRRLHFSPDGRFLAGVVGRANDPRRRPVLFDRAAGTACDLSPGVKAGRAGDPAFAPDPRLTAELLVRSDDATFVRLTDARGDRPDVRTLAPRGGEAFTAAGFSADGETLFVGLAPAASDWPEADPAGPLLARLDVGGWLAGGDPDRMDDDPPGTDLPAPTCFADSGAGLLAVGTAAGATVLYDLFRGEAVVVEPDAADPPAVEGVLLGPDGRHLVTRSAGALAVWDTLTGRELARPGGPSFSDATFAPDGRLLAVSADGGVYRFAPPRYALVERLEFGRGPLYGVAVAADGLVAAAGTGGGEVVLWDV